MRGQRNKREAEAVAGAQGKAVKVIDVSGHKPRRIPSAKWRELIKKVWEADPLLCPKCSREMRIVALIDERAVIERILRHLGLWGQGVRVCLLRPVSRPITFTEGGLRLPNPPSVNVCLHSCLRRPPCGTLFTMNSLFLAGLNKCVPVPPEKRCLINLIAASGF